MAPAAAEPPACALLAAFDTAMLGWASRELDRPGEHDRDVLPGGGMLRAVVLAGERVVGTWRGTRRSPGSAPNRLPPPSPRRWPT